MNISRIGNNGTNCHNADLNSILENTSVSMSPPAAMSTDQPKRPWQSKRNRLAAKERLEARGDRDSRLLHQVRSSAAREAARAPAACEQAHVADGAPRPLLLSLSPLRVQVRTALTRELKKVHVFELQKTVRRARQLREKRAAEKKAEKDAIERLIHASEEAAQSGKYTPIHERMSDDEAEAPEPPKKRGKAKAPPKRRGAVKLDKAALEARTREMQAEIDAVRSEREGEQARTRAAAANGRRLTPPRRSLRYSCAAGARDADVLACVDAASRAADTQFAVVRGVLHDKCEQEAAQGLLSAT